MEQSPNIIDIDSDDMEAVHLEEEWREVDWIGCGKEYTALPDIVGQARQSLLTILDAFKANLPSQNLPVSKFLHFNIAPIQDAGMIYNITISNCFSTTKPSEGQG
jgi:hypothetical protein